MPRQPLLVIGLAAWVGGALSWAAVAYGLLAWLGPLMPLGCALLRFPRLRPAAACVLVGLAAGSSSAALDLSATRPAELRDWADQGCEVVAVSVVRSVSITSGTDIGERGQARLTASAEAVRQDRRLITGRFPVVLIGDAGLLAGHPRGSSLVVRGDLLPMLDWREPGLALSVAEVIDSAPPSGWDGFVAWARARMWDAMDGIDREAASLIAGVAIGDDSRQSQALGAQMRLAGLSHLLAVSGGNVAIVLGVAVGAVSLLGAGRRGRVLAGLVAILGYCAFVGPEPSVLRAATMGTVATLGILRGSARAGQPVLGLAILVLVVAAPALVVSWGFGLSVAATAGILALAGPLHRMLGAEAGAARIVGAAAAVTLAAQVATAPVLAAMTGSVSLVAVPANLLAAPLVAPITLLGLATLVVSMIGAGPAAAVAAMGEPLGLLLARIAGWSAQVPMGAVPVPDGIAGALLLSAALLALWQVGQRHGGWRAAGVGGALLGLVLLLTRPASPPADWIAAACDVGQGDAYVVRTGPESAILIDTGPDSTLLLTCLDELGVRRIDLLVISHYDTDHVAASPTVLRKFRPPAVLLSPVPLPAENARSVRRAAQSQGVDVLTARPDQRLQVSGVSLTVVWPRRLIESGSVSNNAAVATAVEAGGLRLLFTGDLEPLGQAGLMATYPPGAFDVSTIPHHGSANQDPRFLGWTGARLLWVSAGRGNRYGHPRPEALQLAAQAGAALGRTDQDGSLALVVRDGHPALVAWDRPPR